MSSEEKKIITTCNCISDQAESTRKSRFTGHSRTAGFVWNMLHITPSGA